MAPTDPHDIDRVPILRPRLLGELADRFKRRCTVIQAGAGFGKTTLLEQAIEQNRLSAQGVDLYLQCRPGHRFSDALAESLHALFGSPDESDPLRLVRDWIWQRSPEAVVLILDDVHEIPPDSSSADLLVELLRELPTNGHLVLSGRSKAPIPLSRLRARGDVLEIDEERLAFDAEEIERFAALRRLPRSIAHEGIAWPALLELRAAAGADEVADFLLDEVLSHLDGERRKDLARVARLETVDDAAVLLLGDSTLSARELMGPLPLTRNLETGAVAVHSLWRPALSRLPGANEARVLRATAQLLRERGEVESALTLLLEIDDDQAVHALVRDLVERRSRSLGSEALRAILAQLPPTLRDSADGTLLDALTTLREDPERSLPQLERAARLFQDCGDREGEVRALVAQGHIAYFKGDVPRLLELGAYGRELADAGHTAALPLALVAEACGALVRTEPEQALDLIDRARSIATVEGVPDFMVAVLASLDAGYPDRAAAEVERAMSAATPEVRGALEITGLSARWQCGRVGPEDLESIRVWLTADSNDSVHNLAVHLALLSQIAASLGCVGVAREFDDRCQQYIDRSFDGRAPLSLAIARAALDVLAGDEEAGARRLRAAFESGCLDGRPNRHALRGLAFFYLLVPDSRGQIDDLDLAPAWSRGREIGRALVALREDGEAATAAAMDWSRPERIVPFIVPSLLTELHMGALAGGADLPLGNENLRSEVREWLRRVTVRGPESSRLAARNLLSELPIAPEAPIEIRVLGALELRRGGELVDCRDWRRSRVRGLLLHLVARPGCRREELGAALWPERDPESVGNNLRVNLHHLMRVLQPERRGNELAWFLRQEGDRLWLVDHPFLRVDAHEFDAACKAGWKADKAGVPGIALEHFLEALELYRGDYCLEADDVVSIAPERARFRSQFSRTALRAGELLLAKGENERVLELASGVLQLDSFFERAYGLQARALRNVGDLSGARQSLEYGLEVLNREGLVPTTDTENLACELKVAGYS